MRSYRSFCSDLTEALFEEEEEEEEEKEEVEEESDEEETEKGIEKRGLCEEEKIGQHRLDWDSLGVLGLASKLSRDTKSRYSQKNMDTQTNSHSDKKTHRYKMRTKMPVLPRKVPFAIKIQIQISFLIPFCLQTRGFLGQRLFHPQILPLQPRHVR